MSGLLGAPVALVLVLATVYGRWGQEGRAPAMLAGLGAAACGLVIATAVKMALPLVRARPLSAAPFVALAFAAVGVMRLPLVWVVLALAPISIAVAWSRRA